MSSISVAMATYNGARYIREQLDSIAAQTVAPAELVVTDDGSDDDTLAIVRAFAETAPFPVRIHRNPVRLGYRANFMRNIGLCTSDLIALCDQDDVWEADKLACMSAPFADPDVLLCFHESWLIDGAGERTGIARMLLLADRNPPSSSFPMRNPYGFAMMFRRDLLAFSDLWERSVDNLQADSRMAHDQWVFFLASALGTVAFIQEPLAGYRLHDSNTYGLDAAASGLRGRFDEWVRVRSQDFASFVIAARARVAILEQVSARLDPPGQARAALAIERYRALVRHSALRAAIYAPAGTGALRRAGAWLGLLRAGGYGNGTRWQFGRKAALTDLFHLALPRWLVRALLLPPRVPRPAPFDGAGPPSTHGIDGSAATPGS